MERFETAFHEPSLFTRQNIGQWSEAGSVDATGRAEGLWRKWLEEYERPPMDHDARAALDDFVGRRIAEGGSLPES